MERQYELSDRIDVLKYAVKEGRKACTHIIANAVCISAEIIKAEKEKHS